MSDCIETQILAALAAKLQALAWVKTVNYETILVNPTDFDEHQLPAIQFFDGKATMKHQHPLIEASWPISMELVLKSKVTGVVDQAALLNLKQDIENCFGDIPQLAVTGLRQLRYDGFETDVHTFPDYYVVRLDWTALYQKRFLT